MKFPTSIVLLLAMFVVARSQGGDISFWLPTTNTSAKDAQILINQQYITVSLDFTQVYFKTGFLSHLKTIIITTGASHNFSGERIGPTEQVVNVSAKTNDNGQTIGAQKEALTSLIPVAGNAMSLHVTVKGTGEDRFKKLFDILGGGDVKTALNLTDATVARVGAITNIVKGLLANPYTSDKPADILSFNSDFSFFQNNSINHPTSLREGYIVIVSSQKSDTPTFNQLRAMLPTDMDKAKDVFEVGPGGLRYKSNGNSVDNVSYVILVVDQARELGENTNSAWFRKYNDALAKISAATPTTLETATKEANDLWQQGTALLNEDKSYLVSERTNFIQRYKQQIMTDTSRRPGGPSLLHTLSARSLPVFKAVPDELRTQIANFSPLGTDTSGTLQVGIPDAESSLDVSVIRKDTPGTATTQAVPAGAKGVSFKLFPGEYLIRVNAAGDVTRVARAVVGPNSQTDVIIKLREEPASEEPGPKP